MTSEPLWTAKDVAAYLRASVKWVYHHASKGNLPCVHLVGLRRFEPAAIRAWKDANRSGSEKPPAKVVPLHG
jgi:hypothetical protein